MYVTYFIHAVCDHVSDHVTTLSSSTNPIPAQGIGGSASCRPCAADSLTRAQEQSETILSTSAWEREETRNPEPTSSVYALPRLGLPTTNRIEDFTTPGQPIF